MGAEAKDMIEDEWAISQVSQTGRSGDMLIGFDECDFAVLEA